MKKFYALFVLLCATVYGFAQCPTGDITFATQAAIDTFGDSGCTEITGNVWIEGGDITHLDGLKDIESIGGNLSIVFISKLKNLNGLDHLTSIGGYLRIGYNDQLKSLDGLEYLISIGGNLEIYNNAELTDISGLVNIDPNTITNLYIYNNTNLATCNIDAFCEYLATEEPIIVITGNAEGCNKKEDIMAACAPVCPEDITFTTQAEIDAFGDSGCTEITGNINIGKYDTVSNITNLNGLANLTSIGGYLKIDSNPQLANLNGLNGLTNIGSHLHIGFNDQLESLDGLEHLTSIGGDLFISYNDQLENLDGLKNLTSVRAYLTIDSNPQLTDISGLANINPETIAGLVILNNTDLATCNIDAFCEYLATEEPIIVISGNAEGCNEADIMAACKEALGVEDIAMDDYEVRLIPNPVSSGGTVELYVGFPREELKGMKISIYSMSGQLVKEIKSNKEITPIETGGMNPGVYILHVNTGKHTQSLKLLVK